MSGDTFCTLLIALTALILPTICLDQRQRCPDAADTYANGFCYEFVESNKTSSYEQAAQYCHSSNKLLANIHSQEQMTFVAQSMTERAWTQAFIGLRYIRTGWKWVDSGIPLRGQGCSVTSYDIESGLLSDISATMTIDGCINFCSSRRQLYAAVQNSDFCYCTSTYSWSQAASDCWLPCSGATEQTCGGFFSSLAFFSADGAFDNWAKGSPTVNGICAAVHLDYVDNFWVDQSCSLGLPFICKTSSTTPSLNFSDAAATSCGSNVCYYLYDLSTQKNWFNADRYCSEQGGRLASVDRLERRQLLDRLLFSSNLPSNSDVWIGAINYQWFQDSFFNETLAKNLLRFDGWITTNEPVQPEMYPCTALIVRLDNGVFGMSSSKCDDLVTANGRFICTTRSLLIDLPNGTVVVNPDKDEDLNDGLTTSTTATMSSATTNGKISTQMVTTTTIMSTKAMTTEGTSTNQGLSTILFDLTTLSNSSSSYSSSGAASTVPLRMCPATCRNVTSQLGDFIRRECFEGDFAGAEESFLLYSDLFQLEVECSSVITTPSPVVIVQPQAIKGVDKTDNDGGDDDDDSSSLRWWAIVLIASGAVLILALVIFIIVMVAKKKCAKTSGVGSGDDNQASGSGGKQQASRNDGNIA